MLEGIACPVEGCSYALRASTTHADKNMTQHVTNKHNQAYKGPFEKCKLQRPDQRHSFIRVPPTPLAREDLAGRLESEWQQALPVPEKLSIDSRNDRGYPFWFLREGWPQFLGSFLTEHRLREKLIKALEAPKLGSQYFGLEKAIAGLWLDITSELRERDWFLLRPFAGMNS